MIDIAVHELNKYYGSNHVIKGITFEVYSGEKVGLLGKNGSGKTTLFKMISGDELYESGAISKASGKKVEMLAQIPVFGENDTAEDILRSSFKEITDTYTAMKKIEGDDSPLAFAQYGRLVEEYERLGGYNIELRLDKVCNGMNIDERMRKSLFNHLSGGERTRINLARILLRDCDILLLDEPTNHLDLISLEWLEKFLREFSGTVVVISHDRFFLDEVVTRIIEIDNGKANFYQGNYSFYVDEKERRFLSQAEQYEQQRKKIRQLEIAAKRLHNWAQQADSAALHKRAFAIEKRIERMDKLERPVVSRVLTAGFDSGGYSSKEIVSFDSVDKRYGTKILLNDLNLKIYRNDRIALVGPNGCGKTTLIKLIMNEELFDSGTIKISANAKIAYMSQIIEFENNDATILETLRSEADISSEKARSILAGFHFKGEDVMKKVGALSGGEKSRLNLCLMMQSDVNFLLLDEPTNHLDIASREWIENVLADFDGTVLFVSHDRYFLNKFADMVWDMNNGTITKYDYGFDEYLEKIRSAKGRDKKKKNSEPKKRKKEPPVKLISTEALIAEAEMELNKINTAMESYPVEGDYQKLNTLCEEKRILEEKIDFLYKKWISEN